MCDPVSWAIIIGSVVTAATTATVSASNAHQQHKAMKAAAHNADMRAQEIARRQKEASAKAAQEAHEKTIKRSRAIQSANPYMTQGDELEDPTIKRKTLLGS